MWALQLIAEVFLGS